MKKDASGRVRVDPRIREALANGDLNANVCEHIVNIQDVTPAADGCQDCLKMGDSWVHLRLCMTCGYVGCCDDSKNKHATHHFHKMNHPVITSYEKGENWVWCFADQLGLNP